MTVSKLIVDAETVSGVLKHFGVTEVILGPGEFSAASPQQSISVALREAALMVEVRIGGMAVSVQEVRVQGSGVEVVFAIQ